MSIVVISASGSTPSSAATTTGQDIVDCTSQDIRTLLASSGADATILLDYTDRIQKRILRESRWDYLLSAPQYFITEDGQVDYWLGASGSNTLGTVDTGLNLTDFDRVKDDSVWDRSNFRLLKRVDTAPNVSSLQQRDGQMRQQRPAVFRHDLFDSPSVLSLYPAPNNQNSYQPVPAPPNIESTAGGALSQGTYFVKITFVDSLGNESSPSEAARQTIAASRLAKVKSPRMLLTTFASGVSVTGYKVYASITENSEVLQNGGAAINLGTDWTEGAGGLATGTAGAPSTNALEPLRGFLMEFRYYKTRPVVDDGADILMVPDIYKDIVCAGVNWLASKYLKMWDDSRQWSSEFHDGLRQMVRDKNLHPHGPDFMRPDPSSGTTSSTWPGTGGAFTQDSWPSI